MRVFGQKFAAALLACVFLLGTAMAATAQDKPKKLRIGYLVADQLHHPALMVMKHMKLLEKAGFDVTWNEFLAGSYVTQEMSTGTLDFAVCGVAPVVIAHAQGVKLNILAGGNQEGSALIVSSKVNDIKDLASKKVGTPGTGSMQDAMIEQLAKKNDTRVLRMSMKVSDMPLYLDKGEIEGFIAWEPHVARAVDSGFGKVLYTSHDMMPNHQCCVLFAPAGNVKSDPETVKKVVGIYLEAYQWFLDHPEEATKMVMKSTGITKEKIVQEAMGRCSYPKLPYCNEQSITDIVKILVGSKKIVGVKPEQIQALADELYNPSFIETLTQTKKP